MSHETTPFSLPTQHILPSPIRNQHIGYPNDAVNQFSHSSLFLNPTNQLQSHQYQIPPISDQPQQNKLTFHVEFKRDQTKIRRKHQALFEALKKMDGMKNWELIKVDITKIERNDSDDDDDDDDDIISNKNNTDNKQSNDMDINMATVNESNTIKESTTASTDITDYQYTEVMKFSLIHSLKNKTNKTEIKSKIGIRDDVTTEIFHKLKELGVMRRPGSCHYYFADNVFCGEEIQYKGTLYPSKINENLEIDDTKIQKIYKDITKEVNEKRPLWIKEIEMLRLEKRKLKKRKLNKTNVTELPQTKKQKLDALETSIIQNQNNDNNNTDNTNTSSPQLVT